MIRPALLLVFLLSFNCVLAHAQALPGDRDLIRERQERVLEEQRRRLKELQQLPGKPQAQPPAVVTPEGHCFDIQSIKLSGANLITQAQQDELLTPFLGRCLGSGELNNVLKTITGFYLDRGYVTSRAYLPQQDLSDGELEVLVIEGWLEGLDSSELASDRELAMTFPGEEGERLNLRELEQLVDQLGRLPSRRAQLELVPGEQPGSSRVRLQGERSKPWHASLSRHNDGQESTGEQQWSAGLDWDSPLGLGDQLRLRGSVDAVSDHWRHSASQSLFYSLPFGWWSFDYSYSQNYYRTRASAAGLLYESDGESKRHQFTAERVIHRDNLGKTALNVGVGHLRTRNYLQSTLLSNSSNRISEFQLGGNHGRRVGTAFANVDIGWQHGTGAFDAQGNDHPQGSQPVARYDKYSLTASYLQPITLKGQRFSLDSLISGQYSEDVLFSPQRISLGGLASIRGFKEQTLSGDSGLYWRSNVRWQQAITQPQINPWLNEVGIALGYDLGVISGTRYNANRHGRLAGNALELSARGPHIAASLTLAQSLSRPDVIDRAEHPVYFRFDLFF
ncbi:MAG TPA: ShlB/FhaC/HecB family hemolysin secretion/activation protein [Pseudomonas sabulinigri]|uniref:POTRA domain-containing protein n=1 Tax=marine sediment metagenome TaxID=412755 RepID=A0A0F9YTU2_9ZZZZ|nr:ShlB/FhaC/HecB family hemolysin secretion/activation protein [Halopseudomonas sabulinigri]HEC51760.1 ShlB/FhaC/HecB family hemolysin secretion/activation protein [Halopseudomonas sabulinigri]